MLSTSHGREHTCVHDLTSKDVLYGNSIGLIDCRTHDCTSRDCNWVFRFRQMTGKLQIRRSPRQNHSEGDPIIGAHDAHAMEAQYFLVMVNSLFPRIIRAYASRNGGRRLVHHRNSWKRELERYSAGWRKIRDTGIHLLARFPLKMGKRIIKKGSQVWPLLRYSY